MVKVRPKINISELPTQPELPGFGKNLTASFLDTVPVAIYSCDHLGHISAYNSAAISLWGRDPEIDKDLFCGWWKLYTPDGLSILPDSCPMAKTIKSGLPIQGEEVLVQRPDGTFRNILAYPVPLINDQGLITGALNTLIDVTEKRIQEGKQAMLAAIIDSSEDAIISKNLQGVITSWNNGARLIFGYSEEEVIGKNVEILIPKDRISEELTIIEHIRNGKKVSHFETVRVTKNGTYISISLSVSPIKNALGKVIGASKIARDISAQKQVESSKAQHSKRLEILNSIGKMISENLDVKDVLQKVTDATTHLTGADFGAFYYYGIKARDVDNKMFSFSEKFQQYAENKSSYGTFFSNLPTAGGKVIRLDDVTKDEGYANNKSFFLLSGEEIRIVSYLAVPVNLKTGEIIGTLFFSHSKAGVFNSDHEAIVVSIASQSAVALENAKLFEEIKSLSIKKDEFIAMASHEIKTPLTTINGYLQLMNREIKEGRSKLFLEKTLSHIGKLNSLISDLFDMSKIQSGKLQLSPVVIDLKKLVMDVLETFEHEFNSRHQFILEYEEATYFVKADKQRMEQVLANLIANAIKFSANEKKIIIKCEASADEITVNVRDFGIGITKEQQQHLFTQFYRADIIADNIPGLGLGLYITKQIIDRHLGKIWVTSEYGKGAQFSFSIPAMFSSSIS